MTCSRPTAFAIFFLALRQYMVKPAARATTSPMAAWMIMVVVEGSIYALAWAGVMTMQKTQ